VSCHSGGHLKTWPDGRRYEGEYANGKLNGKGVDTWSDGRRNEGDFANGNLNGKGLFTWLDGRRYEGDFANGEANGKGVFNFPNGNRYEGGFVDGKKSGSGVFILADGTRYTGLFRDNQFVESKDSTSKAPESIASNGGDTSSPFAQFFGAALGAYAGTRLMQGGSAQSPVPSIDANSLQMNCDTRRTTMGANIGMNQSYQINCR
jgi:hypothetical protein